MDSKKLEILMTAADLGSFTRAAEATGYTQSGLTHMMDSLEREIGFPLLERGRSGVCLTSQGRELMPSIRAFLKANAALDSEIGRLSRNGPGVIRIAAYASIAMHWLPEIIYQFRREVGDTDVDLRMVDHAVEPFELLTAGKADLIFASKQDYRDGEYDWIPLYREPVCAILPMSYPLEGRDRLPLKELERKDFIIPYGRFDIDVRRAFAQAGAVLQGQEAHVDDETVIRMVERGLGVSLMAELMYSGRCRGVRCVPLDPPVYRELGMGVRSRERAAEPIRQMMACVERLLPSLREQKTAR